MRKIRESNQYICWNVSLMTLPLMLSEIIIFIKGFSSLFTFEILPSFMANYPMCSKIAWIICALCGLHELYECVSSKDLLEKMISHKIHICVLCGLHELYECASSKFLLHSRIYHKIHICNLCDHHEVYGCVSSNNLL